MLKKLFNTKLFGIMLASTILFSGATINAYADTTNITTASSIKVEQLSKLQNNQYTGNLIPKMTTNIERGGEAIEGGKESYRAFNRVDTYWQSNDNKGFVGYKFLSAKKICKYAIRSVYTTSSSGAPKNWTFEGSNDGTNWTVLDTRANVIGWNSLYKKEFTFDDSNSYTYYRINITATEENGYAAIDELEMMEKIQDTSTILNIEPEKNKIKKSETVTANLTIDNIKEIAAEDIRIKYDAEKLQFLNVEEVDGIKLVKNDTKTGELRFILASKGEANIIKARKTLLKLNFKGIKTGEAIVDVVKGRVSDGIEMENNLTDEQCGQGTIIIEDLKDVNNSGEFTLLDLAIDARHLGKDPKSTELTKYNTDIVVNNAIDDDDLLEIGKFMLENPNYEFNK